MESQYSSCSMTCPRCGHAWTYMGTRLRSLERSKKPVKTPCPRCFTRAIMDIRKAR